MEGARELEEQMCSIPNCRRIWFWERAIIIVASLWLQNTDLGLTQIEERERE